MLNPTVDATNSQLKDITEKFNSGFDVGLIAFLLNKSRIYILLFFVLSFLHFPDASPTAAADTFSKLQWRRIGLASVRRYIRK